MEKHVLPVSKVNPKGRISKKKRSLLVTMKQHKLDSVLRNELIHLELTKNSIPREEQKVWNGSVNSLRKTLRSHPHPLHCYKVQPEDLTIPAGLALNNHHAINKIWWFYKGGSSLKNVAYFMDDMFVVAFYVEGKTPRLQIDWSGHGAAFGLDIVSTKNRIAQSDLDNLASTPCRVYGYVDDWKFTRLDPQHPIKELLPMGQWGEFEGNKIPLIPNMGRKDILVGYEDFGTRLNSILTTTAKNGLRLRELTTIHSMMILTTMYLFNLTLYWRS